MKKCTIVAYIDRDPSLLIQDINDDNFLIAADIGLSYCLEAGLRPDLIVGDFDSCSLPEDIDSPVIKLPVEKDYTDLDVAIQKASELGYTDITVLGGLGRRLDQTVANIQLLIGAKEKGIDVVIKDLDNEARIITDNISIEKREGYFLSLFAVNGPVSGLSIKGVKYETKDTALTEGFPLGVSNEITSDFADISLKEGMLLVIESKNHL